MFMEEVGRSTRQRSFFKNPTQAHVLYINLSKRIFSLFFKVKTSINRIVFIIMIICYQIG